MGIWEIGIIIIVALVVLGPKQLPQVTKVVGQFWRQGQTFLTTVQNAAKETQKQATLAENIAKADAAEAQQQRIEKPKE